MAGDNLGGYLVEPLIALGLVIGAGKCQPRLTETLYLAGPLEPWRNVFTLRVNSFIVFPMFAILPPKYSLFIRGDN